MRREILVGEDNIELRESLRLNLKVVESAVATADGIEALRNARVVGDFAFGSVRAGRN